MVEVDSHAGTAGPDRSLAIDFGVVNYNGGDAVVRCVGSILGQARGGGQVVVFDNASSDGSADAVAAAFPEVDVIRSPRNLGYAGALNRLLDRLSAELVVLSNMDLEFDPGWAEAVRTALAVSPEAGAVATPVVEQTDPPVLNSLGVRFFADLHAQNVGSGEPYAPEILEDGRARAFGSYGAVMCFRRSTVADLRFDEDYFLFFEETDFFLRFHLLGGRTTFAPGAVSRHRRSLSTRRYSPLKLYYGERNRLTTVLKLLPVWYWPLSFLHTLRRLIVLARRPADPEPDTAANRRLPPTHTIVATLVRAWLRALIRLPGTWQKRRAFWAMAPGRPRDALTLMRDYRLTASELRLR